MLRLIGHRPCGLGSYRFEWTKGEVVGLRKNHPLQFRQQLYKRAHSSFSTPFSSPSPPIFQLSTLDILRNRFLSPVTHHHQIQAFSSSSPSSTNQNEKKRVEWPMPPSYDPVRVENGWYSWWQSQGYFVPSASSSPETPMRKDKEETKVFSMVIPPPNVTGSLHIGHALTIAIQDSLVRWRRMKGESVLWIPGLDHAGISTQVVVEKQLAKASIPSSSSTSPTTPLTRHHLGREKFLEEVWKWKNQSGSRISEQIKRMGASLDWSREAFTMDTQRSNAVIEAFVRLFEKDLIYRDLRVVNWCPFLRTVISDIEVEYEEIQAPQKANTQSPKITVPGLRKK